jgi:hypothetical protein
MQQSMKLTHSMMLRGLIALTGITGMPAALQAATITADCNGDGRIRLVDDRANATRSHSVQGDRTGTVSYR